MDGNWDVVVVGSGNAALCAAIAAREAGRRVLVIEKAGPELAGGNSRYTAGAIASIARVRAAGRCRRSASSPSDARGSRPRGRAVPRRGLGRRSTGVAALAPANRDLAWLTDLARRRKPFEAVAHCLCAAPL